MAPMAQVHFQPVRFAFVAISRSENVMLFYPVVTTAEETTLLVRLQDAFSHLLAPIPQRQKIGNLVRRSCVNALLLARLYNVLDKAAHLRRIVGATAVIQ